MNLRGSPFPVALLAAVCLASLLCGGNGAVFTEDFAAPPDTRGWYIHGDPNLFGWDSASGKLQVTWDSSCTNSFFYHPLGTKLAKEDDFALAFDVRLSDIEYGTTPGKPYTFQIAVGLQNLALATRTNFFRGAGISTNGPRSVVEFNYFPDSGYGATLSQVMIATNNQFRYANTYPLEFTPGATWRVDMRYTASNGVLTTRVSSDGELLPFTNTITLGLNFTDYRLDTLAVSSYSDGGQASGAFAGSILAHGVVDNFALSFPDPPRPRLTIALTNGAAEVSFVARSNWLFVLERSLGFASWIELGNPRTGAGGVLKLLDGSPPASGAYYRVQATRP